MNNENKVLEELEQLLTQFNEQKKGIYNHYVQLVTSVFNGLITSETDIERIMDGLLDFCDDECFLQLYKRLCRYVYDTFPQMVGEHINLFRMQFEEKEDEQ